jgi:hypothetical protein
MTSDEEMEKYFIERMASIQTQFDTTKSTLLTAGLLVAIGLSFPNLQTSKILGHSGLKIVMACTIVSAIFLVLSYIFAEHQAKRFDKLTGAEPFTLLERLVLHEVTVKNARQLAWFYTSFHNFLITAANNLSTLFLLLGLVLFLYLLVW